MSIKPQFIIVCEKAFLTANSNNLNIIGVFTQLNADKFPFTYSQFALVINFDADEAGQHLLRTDIMDPAGKQVAHTELPVAVTIGNMQVIANFENMQFPTPGAYTINIALDGQPLGQRIIHVAPVVRSSTQKTNLA